MIVVWRSAAQDGGSYVRVNGAKPGADTGSFVTVNKPSDPSRHSLMLLIGFNAYMKNKAYVYGRKDWKGDDLEDSKALDNYVNGELNGMPYYLQRTIAYGTHGAEYEYLLGKRLAIGASLTWTGRRLEIAELHTNAIIEKRVVHYINLMPTINYYWYGSRKFGLYSGVSGGLSFNNAHKNLLNDDWKVDPTFHLTGIGVSGEWNGIIVKNDLGYGARGIFTMSVGYVF